MTGNEIIERLKRDFSDPDYRCVYAEDFLNSSIATQIKVLREEREWTQADLAKKTGKAQSRISEIEDINYSSWSIRTLRRLARAFDLRLKVTFEEFGTLLSDFTKLNRESLQRNSFSTDPAFMTQVPEFAYSDSAAAISKLQIEAMSHSSCGVQQHLPAHIQRATNSQSTGLFLSPVKQQPASMKTITQNQSGAGTLPLSNLG
jgi:transcriptional regulator with XRE-family HTH domain